MMCCGSPSTGVSVPQPRLVCLFVFWCDSGKHNTSKQTDPGSCRPAALMFCKGKLLFLLKESGGFEESVDGLALPN